MTASRAHGQKALSQSSCRAVASVAETREEPPCTCAAQRTCAEIVIIVSAIYFQTSKSFVADAEIRKEDGEARWHLGMRAGPMRNLILLE
jgi:hypothetical protein